MKRDRTVRTLFSGAILLTVVGLGNLIFGQVRLAHYESALSDAASELSDATANIPERPADSSAQNPLPTSLNIERQNRLIDGLKARVDFYTLVVLGGRCMLAAAGVCLLGILLHRGISAREE